MDERGIWGGGRRVLTSRLALFFDGLENTKLFTLATFLWTNIPFIDLSHLSAVCYKIVAVCKPKYLLKLFFVYSFVNCV